MEDQDLAWPERKWMGISMLNWGIGAGLSFVGTVLFSFFFVRRRVAQYRVENHFPVDDPSFFASAFSLADPNPINGNKIDLLNNGDEIFPALLDAIQNAERTVNFEAFFYESGQVGAIFRDALCERARAGLVVRVLLDGVGAGYRLDDSYVETMQAAGCLFAYYNPTRSWRIDRLNRRSHRRLLVVDGKIGFTGGVGFADCWQGNADSPDHWRDVHARLEGPIVNKLQAAFQSHWVSCTGESLSGPYEFPQLEPAGSLMAQVVPTQAFGYAPLAFMQAVSFTAAEKSIRITNAYCAPSDAQVDMLIAAVRRGVDVQLLLPGKHNDQPITKAAGRTAYGKLLKGGVQIFEYQPTMIHSKTLVVDGLLSVFGTSNFDARSSQINDELDVAVYDAEFARRMEETFRRDLEAARPYLWKDFRKRPIWERVGEWIIRPFYSQI